MHFAPHEKIRERVAGIFAVARAKKFVERQFVLASQFLQINFVHLPRIKVAPCEKLLRRPILTRERNNDNTQQLFPSEFVRNALA